MVDERSVLGFGFHEILGEGRFGLGVEEDEIGWLADFDRDGGQTHQTAGLGGIALHDEVPAEFAGRDEVVVKRDQRGIHAGDAVGRADEILGFLERRVRRVVGGDEVEDAVDEPLEQPFVVGLGAQRRVHFVIRIEVADVLVGE